MSTKFRVLWTDAASEGRFTDIEALSVGEAIWKAAIGTESTAASFMGVISISKTGNPRLLKPTASASGD
jgi:hypothetical protein